MLGSDQCVPDLRDAECAAYHLAKVDDALLASTKQGMRHASARSDEHAADDAVTP